MFVSTPLAERVDTSATEPSRETAAPQSHALAVVDGWSGVPGASQCIIYLRAQPQTSLVSILWLEGCYY